MEVPPEIVFKGVKETPYLDNLINRGIAGLEQVCDYIVSTRIALEKAQGRHHTGDPLQMRIDIRIPDRADIIVKRSSKAAKKSPSLKEDDDPEELTPVRRTTIPRRKIPEEALPALIRRTFDSARRELDKIVDKQKGKVKTRVGGYLPENACENHEYIRNIADSNVFVGKRIWTLLTKKAITDIEVLEAGIGFEKDSILLYSEIRGMLPRQDQNIIDMIVNEEKKHLSELTYLAGKLRSG